MYTNIWFQRSRPTRGGNVRRHTIACKSRSHTILTVCCSSQRVFCLGSVRSGWTDHTRDHKAATKTTGSNSTHAPPDVDRVTYIRIQALLQSTPVPFVLATSPVEQWAINSTRGGGRPEQAFPSNRLPKRWEDPSYNSTQSSIAPHPYWTALHEEPVPVEILDVMTRWDDLLKRYHT